MSIDEATTVDTENYFAVAQSDEQANASGSGTATPAGETGVPLDDKASRKARRDQRIIDAVKRSKVEYTADNVYTERGWFLRESDRGVSKQKIDSQRLEFLTASLYYSAKDSNDHASTLALILDAFKENPEKPSGGLSRELLDIGIKSAIKAGNTEEGVRLARSGRNLWKTQWASPACTAHDAFICAGQVRESLTPLISCMSISGPQYPLITRLRSALTTLYPASADTSEVTLLITKIEDVIRKSEGSANRPMFGDEEKGGDRERERIFTPERAALDTEQLGKEMKMDDEESRVLGEAVRRLEKATRSAEEPAADERGVRQL